MTRTARSDLSFRRLRAEDAEAAGEIAASAFGPSKHRVGEIRRYLEMEPNYWLLANFRGRPAGVVGGTDYGPFVALGMMTVRKELQRRGIGHSLFLEELRWLESEGLGSFRLYATPEGLPIYQRNGFERLDRSVLFLLRRTFPPGDLPNQVDLLTEADLDRLAAFDTPAFGADRRSLFKALLRDFPGRAFVCHEGSGEMAGFLFAQPRRIGPWVAYDPSVAEPLLRAALTLPFDGSPVAVISELNQGGIELLKQFGFTPGRDGVHMQRGMSEVPGDRSLVYGLTSFAIG